MLTLFNPFATVKTFSGKSLFDSLFNDFDFSFGIEQNIDDKGDLSVSIDVPGMKESDLNIDVSDNVITIKGERKTKTSSYQIHKSFTLPDEYDKEKINAELKDGVLTLSIMAKQLPEVKEIKKIPITTK